MRLVFVLILAVLNSFCFSQKFNKDVRLEILSYKDSVIIESDAFMKCRLTNNGKSPIIISNSIHLYCIVIRDKGGKKDTTNTENWFKKADIQFPDGYKKSILKPGESINFEFGLNIYGANPFGEGLIRFKLLYELKELNKDVPDAESRWITQYFKKIIIAETD